VNVARQVQKVFIGIDQDGLVTPSEQCTVAALVAVEKLGIHAVEMPHAAAEIPERRMQQQMVMIVHQAIGVRFDPEPVGKLAEQFEKSLALRVGNEYVLAPRAAIHHVVPRTLKFDSQRPGHGRSI